MKKFLCMAITVMMLLTLAILPALAESSPLMYKVTDKDGHSIYVLGTLHMTDKDTLPIKGLDEILGNVDRVIFELSAEDMEKVVHAGELAGADAAQLAGSIENDVPVFVLDNGLSEETLNLLAGFFSRAFQQEMEADNLRMISVPVLYQMLQAQLSAMSGYDSSKSVDFAVYEKAKELGKKIEGAETIAEQVKAVNAEGVNQVASEKQIQELLNDPAKVKDEMDAMVRAYNNGDKDTLVKIFSAEGARSAADAGRNANFLKVAEKALADGGRTLIAIGIYHIIAEDGLFNALTQAGYTVEAVNK